MKKIVFDAGAGGPNYQWGDWSVDSGVGGSEECLIRLAREFALLGHGVTIFNKCGNQAGEYNGVLYKDYTDASRKDYADILISQRDWLLLENREAGCRVLSCHDRPNGCHMPNADECFRQHNPALAHIDKVAFLNPFHRSLSPWIPDDRCFIAPIGLPNFDLGVIERDAVRCCFTSHPNRGIDQLRAIWPRVREAVPEATLHSFWWEEDHFRAAEEHLGIMPMRRLNAREVQIETAKSSILSYPCTFTHEISPQTVLIAQLMGTYPVTVPQGGMCDVQQFGFKTDHGNFADVLIETLRLSIRGDLEEERHQMQDWARSIYSWPKVAAQWLDALSPQ